MPDATGLELIAQELREAEPESVIDTTSTTAAPSCRSTRRATSTVLHAAARQGLPVPRQPARRRLLPGGTPPRRALRTARHARGRPDLGQGPGPDRDPQIATVTDLWPGADFPERECYDMFGVVFDGHPDLRRILMPEDYEGYPQRRDFPVGGEPVLFTYNEETTTGSGNVPLRRAITAGARSRSPLRPSRPGWARPTNC